MDRVLLSKAKVVFHLISKGQIAEYDMRCTCGLSCIFYFASKMGGSRGT